MVLRFLEPRLPHSCMDCFEETECTVSITVVGESGDLAKKKIFPALFVLYYYSCLPKHFTIFGYARSKMTDAELRTMVSYVKTFAELTRGRIVVKGWTNFLKDVSTTQISVIHRINLHSWTRNYRNMRVEEFLTACSIYLFLQTYS